MSLYATHLSSEAVLRKRLELMEIIVVSFMDEDMEHVTTLHDDTLVITTQINDFDVTRVMVDSESSTNVLLLDSLLARENMNKYFKKVDFSLIEFA